jgi:hypothetical protein
MSKNRSKPQGTAEVTPDELIDKDGNTEENVTEKIKKTLQSKTISKRKRMNLTAKLNEIENE